MRDFSTIYKDDLDIVGKKAVELAELTRLEIPIPDGFVVTTNFFRKFLDQTGISEKIKEVQKLNHPAISDSIEKLYDPIKKQIAHTRIPENLASELREFYKKLTGLFQEPSLNIFSSSPFSNKSVIFKNVKGDANFVLKIKEIWASHVNIPVAIVIQKNIQSEVKGTTFTTNPIKELESVAKKIQKHFYFHKELDFVIKSAKIYITGFRPFTGEGDAQNVILQNKKVKKILIKGISINPGIVTGRVKIINNNVRTQIKSGEIIILSRLNKSLFDEIKKAKGIVADGILSNSFDHMFYKKNISVPTIAGTVNAMKILQNGKVITLNGSTGEIYSGGLI